MRYFKAILTICFSGFFGQLFCQDTTIYTQTNSLLSSDSFTFLKKNKSDNFGFFLEHKDDGDMRSWSGKGTFSESKSKIVLLFDTSGYHNRVKLVYSSKHVDTIYVKWLDWWGRRQGLFRVEFFDAIKKDLIFIESKVPGVIKIPKSSFKEGTISLFGYDSARKIIEFKISKEMNEASIFANDPTLDRVSNKRKVKLTKNKKGFTSVNVWGKKVQFVKR